MSDFKITLEDATKWIKNWRTNLPKDPAKAHLIQKQALLDVMEPSDVVAIRAYMAIDDDGIQKVVLVGVDANGQDLVDDNHILVDRSLPCPPYCSGESVLLDIK
ncbi:MAG: hypothetical protein ACK4M1_04405 [Flavobacterium sp.]|jgi:hypothetical protein